MGSEDRIDIDVFKVVARAIGESGNLEIMANHLTQLLVGALQIKGCTLFIHNPENGELEILASFGLSMKYLHKGPIAFDKSIGCIKDEKSIVIGDISGTDRLQYPEEALKEGIQAIISVPIIFYGETIGALRFYHHECWGISDKDLDSLHLLAETIGLAMMYTRLLNAVQIMQEAIKDLPLDLTQFGPVAGSLRES
jgi:signal transduction protein with GAF and PtsI domain